MRIGIVTIQKCDNFGADLQAYALGAKLRKLGYDAENIDYVFYKHPRHLGGKNERPVLPISFVNRLKERLFPLIERMRKRRAGAVAASRRQKFETWFKTYVPCGREYRSVADLYADPPLYDAYVVGSDQVWNPRMGSNILPYFLDFAPAGSRCVSYASSLGVSELPGGVFYRYKQWLRRFTAISLREEVGVDIVKAMALEAEVRHVVDPTLLLDAEEWSAVSCAVSVPSRYLLLYDLIASEETVALAKRWAAARKIEVVRIGDGAYGPGEFVWLFAHAECVVTNSFHGTAFAVNHAKPFVSIIPRGMTNASRIESLLSSLGLTDRLASAADCENCAVDNPIDFAAVSEKLGSLRKDSVAFLDRALGDAPLRMEHKLPLGCYAVWNADGAVRVKSTSGGMFRILAESVISRGGVVYGAAFSKDFHSVRHQAARTVDDLLPIMKSKYVWSDPTAAYRESVADLKAGREVLFTGTPCQIAAIKSLARGFDARLLTMDIVCHGTPHAEYFSAYIRELEERFGAKMSRYDFRNKDSGWNFPHVEATFAKGCMYNAISGLDPYCMGFEMSVILRPGCFHCPYANLERVSDFSIADCWRVAASHPEWDDGRGTSLVLVNTSRAMELWETLLKSGKINGGEYDLDLAQMRNMPLMQRARKPAAYDAFRRRFEETGSFNEAAKCYMSRKRILKATLVYWIKKLGWSYFKHHQ